MCGPCPRQALFWTLHQAIALTKRMQKAVRQGVREYAGMMVGGEPPHRYQTGEWFSLLVTKAGPNQAALSLGNGTMPPSAALTFQPDSRRVLESSEGYTPALSLSVYLLSRSPSQYLNHNPQYLTRNHNPQPLDVDCDETLNPKP